MMAVAASKAAIIESACKPRANCLNPKEIHTKRHRRGAPSAF
jgi:hypothetical protein